MRSLLAHIRPYKPGKGDTVAAIRSNAQPEVVKLTTSSGEDRVRRLMLRIGGPFDTIQLEVEIPDHKAFLDEVRACAQWVNGPDGGS